MLSAEATPVARVILSAQATPVARVILSAQATPASPAKTSFRERASPKVAGSPLIGHRHKRPRHGAEAILRRTPRCRYRYAMRAMATTRQCSPWTLVEKCSSSRESSMCTTPAPGDSSRAVQGVSDWRASGLLAWHFRWADGANNGRPNAMPRPRDRSAADLFTPVGRRRFVARRQDSETSTRPSSLPHSAQREFLDRPVAVYRARP